MRENLYWKMEKFSLRYAYFTYFDTTPYLADQLFIKHQVSVWFDKEFERPGSPYIVIFCHVRKRDVAKFLAALEDLKKSMMVCGHPKYQAEISAFMDEMEKLKGAMDRGEDDAAGQTEQAQTT